MRHIVMIIIVLVAIVAASGCKVSTLTTAQAFYPKENHGQTYKSRLSEGPDAVRWAYSWGTAR